ncbi:hypothetical protein FOMG_20032 [Fusarium oxysporum f. sp. melonis 26406]|uniref:Uncharacterized protein n=1 Tax=Fusarium oxysporum f. sp. melonis 26406 TaxID=1089452 RepID=W9Z3I9_FUSOX|nr:hypothetical protein FOMG_20032 [Fusarium oxysporum f. sp. melonis 26406]
MPLSRKHRKLLSNQIADHERQSNLPHGFINLYSIKAHEPLALASCANDEYTDDKTAGGDKKTLNLVGH